MGPSDPLVNIEAFGTSPEGHTFEAESCNVTIAHEEISCLTPVGAGKDIAWTVVIDEIESKYDLTAYAPPHITEVIVNVAEASVAGNDPITIKGKNFGPPTPNDFLEEISYGVR